MTSKGFCALAIIPARYQSSRFPGKPLAKLFGKPMICHTYEATKRSSVSRVLVATDDHRIREAVEHIGGEVAMTGKCETGTERVFEAAHKVESEGFQYDLVVNVQGDEPLVNPNHIDNVVQLLRNDKSALMSTIATPIRCANDAIDNDVVKCVLDSNS
jgi:3-deoxy-manno-octulosonate cytidylyltransferase (CMP-KDO synthetase)